ncbi:hypothetical protein HPB49_008087 [Dermacentor silvarum]|uniref:Uncharacterized protein n=1 Tax=Dermacentor silvarum TaxID=543639 RepID=A0ACB8C2P2_DERSI|nr:hypothetical protein HPB49_008087 [Dermacentor silvarum]
MLNPTEDHQCDPRCSLCGKGHLAGDKQCREWFKTPYILKKRYWERVQHEQQGTKQPRDDSTPTKSYHQGTTQAMKPSVQDKTTRRRRGNLEGEDVPAPSQDFPLRKGNTEDIDSHGLHQEPCPGPHRGRGDRRHHKRPPAAPEERQQMKV